MDLINKLGVDWRLLLAQIANFLILMIVLNYFLYQPILKILQEREQKVKKSMEDSVKIEEELLRIAKEREESLKNAKIEARKIIQASQATAQTERENMIAVAKTEAAKIINQARLETDKLSLDIKQNIIDELSAIIVNVTEKIIAKKITKKEDQKLIQEAIKSLL